MNDIDLPAWDLTPRYAPTKVMTLGHGMRPVISWRIHPRGNHPDACPIMPDLTALECITDTNESRWYGCESAHINSELRMVVIGTPPRDEVRMTWPVCEED